jgi:3'-phosphoadenosine 5'-phosphosulfate sulfotransferase (PAPS reductase)/FAD synthetase
VARAKYKPFEPHRADGRTGRKRRHVDQARPLIEVKETEVWESIARYKLNPHPAYRLGFGRVSCMRCIFGSPDQWASARTVDPARFERVAQYEREFGVTIQRKLNVVQLADKGTPYAMNPKDIAAAMSTTFDEPIVADPWTLPRGAYGDSCGPT